MFGRLPWLAFERRMRALRFLVFFDIGVKAIGQSPERHKAWAVANGGANPGASGHGHRHMAHPLPWSLHTDMSFRGQCRKPPQENRKLLV